MRLRHRSVGVLGATLMLLVLAAPVAADTTGGGNGTDAIAFHDGGCTDNQDGTATCSGTQLEAFKGKSGGDFVCYDDFISTFVIDTGEPVTSHDTFGCLQDAGVVSATKLDSVHVATDLALTDTDCVGSDCTDSDGGTLDLSATWTGVGKILKSSSNLHFRDSSCVEVDQSKSASRNATFDGPFAADNAGISVGTSTFRIRCR
jgi:hypothetical protein